VSLNDRVAKIGDPCGVISVHGYWAVCVGIFADGTYGAVWNGLGASTYLRRAGQEVTGLLHGDTGQFLCQFMDATLCAAWAWRIYLGHVWSGEHDQEHASFAGG